MKRRSQSSVYVRFSPFQYMGGGQASVVLMLAAILLLSVSFVRPGTFGGLRMAVTDTVAPVVMVLGEPFRQAAALVGAVSGFSEMRAENVQLKAENARLREWYQTALMLDAENQSLHALLNVKPDPRHRFITARVVGDSGTSFVKSAIVTAGQADGVQKGQAVLSGDGVVGRIIESGRGSARILLMTDFNSRIPVLVEGSRQKAILTGTNTDLPALRYLPPDTDIKPGTRIITSGDGGLFLSGLPVGTVVEDENGDLYVKPFADISRLTHVRIVDYPEDPNLIEGRFSD